MPLSTVLYNLSNNWSKAALLCQTVDNAACTTVMHSLAAQSSRATKVSVHASGVSVRYRAPHRARTCGELGLRAPPSHGADLRRVLAH